MKKEFSLTIKGFENMLQVEEFVNWYGNQGEDNLGSWLELSDKLEIDFMDIDSSKKQIVRGNNLTVWLEMN